MGERWNLYNAVHLDISKNDYLSKFMKAINQHLTKIELKNISQVPLILISFYYLNLYSIWSHDKWGEGVSFEIPKKRNTKSWIPKKIIWLFPHHDIIKSQIPEFQTIWLALPEFPQIKRLNHEFLKKVLPPLRNVPSRNFINLKFFKFLIFEKNSFWMKSFKNHCELIKAWCLLSLFSSGVLSSL